MTENQLKYLSYQESLRHNAATEALGRDELGETARSNLAREAETQVHNRNVENESQRHNLEQEDLEASKQDETHRHNIVQERVDQGKLAATWVTGVLSALRR